MKFWGVVWGILKRVLIRIISTITLKTWRERRRRSRYEFLKAEISKRHFEGRAGLIVDFKGFRVKKSDRDCFKPPMYQWAQNQEMKWCVFWDRARLTREIGTGAPLQDGEVLIEEPADRMKPSATIETIDEQKPLTTKIEAPVDGPPQEDV